MKHKIFNTIDSYGDKIELIFIDVGRLSLGNNFSLDHFFNALSIEAIDYLYALEHEGENTIFRLKAKGNYGKVQTTICAYDLWDYMRPL